MHEEYSYTYPLVSVARWSFIQPCWVNKVDFDTVAHHWALESVNWESSTLSTVSSALSTVMCLPPAVQHQSVAFNNQWTNNLWEGDTDHLPGETGHVVWPVQVTEVVIVQCSPKCCSWPFLTGLLCQVHKTPHALTDAALFSINYFSVSVWHTVTLLLTRDSGYSYNAVNTCFAPCQFVDF